MLIRDYYSTVPASLEEDVGGLDVIKQAWTRSRIESPRIRGWHAAGHPDLADHPVLRLVLAMVAQACKAYQIK